MKSLYDSNLHGVPSMKILVAHYLVLYLVSLRCPRLWAGHLPLFRAPPFFQVGGSRYWAASRAVCKKNYVKKKSESEIMCKRSMT
jgi:hypothetical protein